MPTPEQKARQLIDAQLVAAGWVIQDRDEMNLGAGLGVAVREYPLSTGPCDYLLFVDRKACGILEAKPEGTTLSGVADQASGYQQQLPGHLANWGEPLRFDYEASGSETLFSDRVDPDQRSRHVFDVHRPETLLEHLLDGGSLRQRLAAMPPLVVDGLRDCQVEAITGLEGSLAQGRAKALIQMTMGAGKTFTAATAAYRLLAHAKAKRVLFLVDRNNLGRQTLKEFQAYRPPGTGRLFTELYNVQRLGPAGLDPDAKVVISTIQRVYSQLTGTALEEDDEEASAFEADMATALPEVVSYSQNMPPETFDVVVIDECHRSIYGRWRQVLDYFDAFQIGLTATPSAHTMGYFNRNLVAQYPYERSVIDKVNVPFEVFRIRTEIGENGSRVPSGFTVPKRDRHTRRQRYEELVDEFVYTAAELDRSVIAPNQIRAVLETFRDTLATELFPGRTEVPKTLIFAKDDHHAEEIVHIAREVFGKGNDFAKKITYRVTGVTPEELISAFRNQYNPRIAVTVDMIATGTDIKPVEVLIFMRDVKSALYFEQMKGRGVRTVNPADLQNVTPDARTKDRFVLIDAVGVSESAKTISTPLEQKPTVGFDKLLEHVASGRSDPAAVSSLAVRLAALDRKLAPEDHARVLEVSGGRTLHQIASGMMSALDNDIIDAAAAQEHAPPISEMKFDATARRLREEALRPLSDNPALRGLLVELKTQSEVLIDVFSPDAVISSAFDERAARELTTKFETFLDENQDQVTALSILYGKPHARKRLTYESLEDLRTALARPPWLLEPVGVWSAYRRLSKGAIKSDPGRVLTDMVALVRYALHQEDGLNPLSVQMAARFNLWLGREEKAGRKYTPEQLGWLEAIRDHLAANIDVTLRDLQDQPAFTARGGVVAARAAFGTRLAELIDDLAGALVA